MQALLSLPTLHLILFSLCIGSAACAWMNIKIALGQYRAPLWIAGLIAILVIGFINQQLEAESFLWIGILLAAAWYHCHSTKQHYSLLVLLVISFLLAVHALPGFNNPIIIPAHQVSSNAVSYSQYLNLDKFIAGLVLFGSIFSDKERITFTASIFKKLWPITLITIALTTLLSLINLVEFDFKLSPYLLLFALNNLFLVCITEEAYFRGLLQKPISKRLKPVSAIIISACLFGIAHFAADNIIYVAMAIIAGGGYAIAYYRTGSVGSSILTHWLLNMVHFIFFTYPFLA